MKKLNISAALQEKFYDGWTVIDKTQPLVYVQCPDGLCLFTKISNTHARRIFQITPPLFINFTGVPNEIAEVKRIFDAELSDFLRFVSPEDVTDQLILLRLREILKERFEKLKKPIYYVAALVLDIRKKHFFIIGPNGDYEAHTESCAIIGVLPNEKAFLESMKKLKNIKKAYLLLSKTFKNIPGIPQGIKLVFENKRA